MLNLYVAIFIFNFFPCHTVCVRVILIVAIMLFSSIPDAVPMGACALQVIWLENCPPTDMHHAIS